MVYGVLNNQYSAFHTVEERNLWKSKCTGAKDATAKEAWESTTVMWTSKYASDGRLLGIWRLEKKGGKLIDDSLTSASALAIDGSTESFKWCIP